MFDSSKTLRFVSDGDYYEVYHLAGLVLEVYVRYDNQNQKLQLIEWDNLSLELQSEIEQRLT